MTTIPPRRSFLAGALAAALAACSPARHRAATNPAPASSSPASSGAPSGADSSLSSSGPPDGLATFVAHGQRDRAEVALTFHVSGDTALVDELFRVVDDRGVPITAFVVGSWLDANPGYAEQLVARGHEVANHTYTHLTFRSLDAATKKAEIERCRDVLVRLTGTPGPYFRPSGTANGTDVPSDDVLRAAANAGYDTVVGYDVDPADYADPGAAVVRDRTIASLQPGSILSLHFGHRGTIDALPEILAALDSRHLQPVTASTLLRS